MVLSSPLGGRIRPPRGARGRGCSRRHGMPGSTWRAPHGMRCRYRTPGRGAGSSRARPSSHRPDRGRQLSLDRVTNGERRVTDRGRRPSRATGHRCRSDRPRRASLGPWLSRATAHRCRLNRLRRASGGSRATGPGRRLSQVTIRGRQLRRARAAGRGRQPRHGRLLSHGRELGHARARRLTRQGHGAVPRRGAAGRGRTGDRSRPGGQVTRPRWRGQAGDRSRRRGQAIRARWRGKSVSGNSRCDRARARS